MTVKGSFVSPKSDLGKDLEPEITFSNKCVVRIHPHENDLMVITVQCDDWKIKRALVDLES